MNDEATLWDEPEAAAPSEPSDADEDALPPRGALTRRRAIVTSDDYPD